MSNPRASERARIATVCTLQRNAAARSPSCRQLLETAHLHAADRAPVVRADHPVRAYDPALQS
eukprot:903367-Prymnesium_polylepis.1